MQRKPLYRRLRVYAFDPSLATRMETRLINQAVLQVPWEPLEPGPVGECVEVVDHDPASGCFYEPVDLDRPEMLAEDGLAPSEGTPQFHQQMVYAVAMRTIQHFERALGRQALWRPRIVLGPDGRPELNERGKWKVEQIGRLRIYPHAMRQANAYYSPEKKALLFGYFPSQIADAGRGIPGGLVFTCLSHDVIAHETTHALLDGLHPHFTEPSNADVLSFHEAFADIVALFQHFEMTEALQDVIGRTRGDLGRQNLLGELAREFGEAMGTRGALRDAIGWVDPATGQWKAHKPDPREYEERTEPHERGALLVAAIFDAFLSIYRARSADLLRIATGGTGALPAGSLHPDLVNRLAAEASKVAGQVLRICIRALDYCPPFDITFGEYLRALITADSDLVPDDPWGYRVAFVEAFRRRGIYPRELRTLGVESLLWTRPSAEIAGFDDLIDFSPLLRKARSEVMRLESEYYRQGQSVPRTKRANLSDKYQAQTHSWISRRLGELNRADRANAGKAFGLVLDPEASCRTIRRYLDGSPRFQVKGFRRSLRPTAEGEMVEDFVIELVQTRQGFLDPKHQRRMDTQPPGTNVLVGDFRVRSGCSLLIDGRTGRVRYAIRKPANATRMERQRQFLARVRASIGPAATYTADAGREARLEPFAALHRVW